MKYDFDEIIDRTNTNAMKLETGKRFCPPLPDDTINLWIADMDFSVAPEILAAMQARLDKRIFGYGGVYDENYYNAVIAWEKSRHRLDIKREEICFSPGIVPAIYNFTRFLVKENEAVITQTPCYHPFDDASKYVKRKLYYNRLINNDGFYTIDFDDFEKKCALPETKLFLLCNPHNPTGRVWTEEELRRLYDICKKHGVRIVSDEIHCDLLRTGNKHIPIARLYPDDKSLITCISVTKTFNLAGLQLSNIIIRDEALRALWRNEQIEGLPNPFSVDASIAALTKCGEWHKELLSYLDENMRTIDEFVKQRLPKATFAIPQGTYLAWIDLSGYKLPLAEMKQRFYYDARVFVEFEDEFADNGDGHIRVNAACPKAVLCEALERLASVL